MVGRTLSSLSTTPFADLGSIAAVPCHNKRTSVNVLQSTLQGESTTIHTDRVQSTRDHGANIIPKLTIGPSRERLDDLGRQISQGAGLHDLESILDGLDEHRHI